MSIPTTEWKLIGIKQVSGGTTISTYIHTTGLVCIKDWSGSQYVLNGKLIG